LINLTAKEPQYLTAGTGFSAVSVPLRADGRYLGCIFADGFVLQETEKEYAGRYRDGAGLIGGAKYTPPDAIDVPMLMRELLEWLKKNERKLHPVVLSALLHHKLVAIHPFFDGNGRTSRLVMNVMLLQKGFPLVIILKADRKK
jgi:Fic family protein